jgi:hypothetical protein
MANASREAELAAARAHLEQLKNDRKAALDAAKIAHEAEVNRLKNENLALETEMDALATLIDKMVADLAMSLPPKAFAAGQKSMRQLRAGFEERFPAIKSKLNHMMDNLAASMNRTATVTITTIHRTQFESQRVGFMAKGGPVRANNAYVVGEKGPELFMPNMPGNIIPNHKLGSVPSMTAGGASRGGGGGGITINVNAGMGANGPEIGRVIVDSLREYERRNGPIPVRTA